MSVMGKKLSEMTLEELWQLFPIYLTKHQSCWQEWYSEEERLLKNALSSIERISHIGSTAVSSIWAKLIIVKDTIPDEKVEILWDNCNNLRDRAMIVFWLSTNICVGELVRLNISDIDFYV